MIKGFDISHNNSVDWSKVSSDFKFVFCKATQGASFKDPAFNDYWQHLKTANMFRGAYHFLTVDDSAEDQVNNFLSRGVDFSKPNVLPPMLDVEDQVPAELNKKIIANKNTFISLATDWIEIVAAKTGRNVIIYSYKNFFAEYLKNHSWPNQYLWLASYQQTQPGLPVGYTKLDFWQYSEYGTFSGQSGGGDLDLDYYLGSEEDLAKL